MIAEPRLPRALRATRSTPPVCPSRRRSRSCPRQPRARRLASRTSRSRSPKHVGASRHARSRHGSSPRSRRRAPPHVERVEIAGPGLPQLLPLARRGCTTCCATVVAAGDRYGTRRRARRAAHQPRVRLGQPHRPAARRRRPLGRGRRRLANLLAAQGAEVHREYYLNDAGTQLDTFGASLYARYRGERAARGRLPGRVPRRDGRRGCGPSSATTSPRTRRASGATATSSRSSRTTSAASACTSTPGSPSGRCTSGATSSEVLDDLDERGVDLRAGRRDVAAGDRLRRPARPRARRSRTARRRTSATTSRTTATSSPAAGTHLIDIWGADHHGQVKSLQAGHGGARLPAGRARGHPRPVREAACSDGEEVRISKRAGQHHHARRHPRRGRPRRRAGSRSCSRASTPPQTFDLDVVTAQSMENPVYYVQYAHARIASIGRKAAERGVDAPRRSTTVDLVAARARARARAAARARACTPRSSPRRRRCARRTGSRPGCATSPRAFHGFYRDCRVHHRRRRAHPGPPLAHRSVPDRPRRRARPPRRAARPTRWRASTTTTTTSDEPVIDARAAPFDRSLVAAGRCSALDLDALAGRVRHAAVRLRRGRPPAPLPRVRRATSAPANVAYAGKAFLCTAMARLVDEEGLAPRRRDRRRAPRRAARRLPGRAHRVPRQQQVGRRAARARSTPASAASSSTRSTSSTASSGSRPRARRAAVLVRVTPGRRGAHARVHRDRHRGLEVRLHASTTATRSAAARARRRRAPRCAFAGLHCHIGSQIYRARLVRARGRDRGRARARRSKPRPARRSTS